MDVVFVYFYPKHDLKSDYEKAGIRLYFLDIPESYHFPLAVSRLVKLIRKEKPDLLVSCLWRADIISRIASLITGVPLVGTLVNDSYSPLAWKDKKGVKHKLVYWLDRITSGIPKHWIANAQALVDSHVKTLGIDRRKISVVYRGRAVPIIVGNVLASAAKQSSTDQKTASSAESIELKYEVSDSRLAVTRSVGNFISYGRLLERKGFQDAIQAFSEVVKVHPDCTLTIFGEGPYRVHLEKQVQELGIQNSVLLPGKIVNPMEALISGYCPLPAPDSYRDCQLPTPDSYRDRQPPTPNRQPPTTNCLPPTANYQLPTVNCFLFPSWYEGFSGALVEAMMAGVPIIASDIPMNLEAVEDQHSALVFPVGDIQALTRQMLWAIRHPDRMKEMGQAAKREAILRFDIETITKEYEEVLKKVTSAG